LIWFRQALKCVSVRQQVDCEQKPSASHNSSSGYDRAGLGKSEHRPNPSYPSLEVVKDLILLVNAQIAPPFVLVGHSVGGMNMRLYASQHAREVVGMVLVDSVHEDEMDRWVAMMPPEIKQQMPDSDKAIRDSIMQHSFCS
jgi:pimeloyl-ACP methyl ester carboxylesterase